MNKILAAGVGATAIVVVLLVGTQLFGRSIGIASQATPTPEPTAHLLLEGTDSGVPVTVTIAAALWHGDPNGGYLCWGDPADICSGPPEGAGLMAFESREYLVYADACHRDPGPFPDTTATTVDELFDALATQVHRYSLQGREDITVDGYAGKKVVLRMDEGFFVRNDCDEGKFALFGLPGDDLDRYSQGVGQIEEVWAVDVDGLIVVLDGTYYRDTPQHAVDELRAILASATFE